VELNSPRSYGHAAGYDFAMTGAGGHSLVSSSDYIFRDGPAGPTTNFAEPTVLPPDLYKSPSSNDYAYIQVCKVFPNSGGAALITVSVALRQTPAYAARLQIRGLCIT